MSQFKILNFSLPVTPNDVRAGILVDEKWVIDLEKALPHTPWARSTMDLFEVWQDAEPALNELASQGHANGIALKDVKLHAPLLYPAAIYCTGANYMEHAKEMSSEGTGVDKSKTQPYLFLKASRHCVIATGEDIRIPNVTNSFDWQIREKREC